MNISGGMHPLAKVMRELSWSSLTDKMGAFDQAKGAKANPSSRF